MLATSETFDRLAPRVRTLAGVLHEDGDLGAVGACVRLQGVDHEVRLERIEKTLSLTVRVGRFMFFRGLLPQWYAAVDRAKRESRPTRKRAA